MVGMAGREGKPALHLIPSWSSSESMQLYNTELGAREWGG